MTEAEWHRSSDPDLMQEYLRRTQRVSDRTYRLFAGCCCRRLAHRLTDERTRQVLPWIERLADGLHGQAELKAVREGARAGLATARARLEAAAATQGISRALAVARPLGEPGGAWLAAAAALQATSRPAWKAALQTAAAAAEATGWVAAWSATGLTAWMADGAAIEEPPWTAPWNAARKTARRGEEGRQAELLRHLVGDPFQPYPVPASWPSTVVDLAEALYHAQDCAFALHDALLDAGHAALAEHFRAEEWHPKGCWVLDLVLGRESGPLPGSRG